MNATTSTQPATRSKDKSLVDELFNALIGLIVASVVGQITELSPVPQLLIAVGLAAALWGIRQRRARSVSAAGATTGSPTVRMFGLIVVGVLIFLAALVAGFTIATTIFLLLWILVMLVLTIITGKRPEVAGLPSSLIAAIAAASLGAGLSIGGGPVVEAARVGTVNLTVEAHNCTSAFVIEDFSIVLSGATIEPDGSPQEIQILPLAVQVEPDENRVRISSDYGFAQSFSLDQVESVSIGGIVVALDTEQEILLKDHDGDRIIITCAEGPP